MIFISEATSPTVPHAGASEQPVAFRQLATGINSTESEMDFTDLGPAMAEAHTRDTAKSAEATAIALSQRVVALEARVAELSDRLDSIVDAINGRES